MQVAPPKGGQPAGASTGWLAERSSAGNDNKRRVAKCAEPALPQEEEGRSLGVRKVSNKKKKSSPFPELTFPFPEAVLFWQKQVAAERERQGSGAGGLQLGAGEWRISAALDSLSAVCLSESQ